MAAYEVLLLNTAIPQIQAAQSGDTYVVPRDIAFSTVASFAAGAEATPSIVATGDTNTGIWFPAADTVAISTGGTSRLRLDSSGNLGLGVTPSAWGSGKAIELGQVTGNALWGLGINSLYLISNARWNGSNYVYTNNGAANLYGAGTGNGTFTWFNAPSGTAGNAISFTQAMTLDASGNLLVGTTSAYKKLTVDGNASIANTLFIRQGATDYGLIYANGNALGFESFQGASITWATGAGGTATERARITSGGYFKASNDGSYFGISDSVHELRQSAGNNHSVVVTNTAATLTGTGARGILIRYTATPNSADRGFVACFDNDGGNERATIRSNGGLANYQSNNVDLSDIRTKTDISPLASYWNKIAALEIVTYKYKDQTHDDLNIGVIAQQVEQVAPEFVDADGFGETPEDGVPLKTIYNKDLTFAAIKALQEAMARIEQLEAKVASLGA